jgi:hypothetical protein
MQENDAKKLILEIVNKLLDQSIDIVVAFRSLDKNWKCAGLLEEGDLYDFVCYVSSESDTFLKGENRSFYAQEYLFKIDKEEECFIQDIKEDVFEFAQKLKDLLVSHS